MSDSERPERGSSAGLPLVLVVDDYADGRDLTRCALESAGFQTVEATNGEDALHAVREHRPDLIVLDLSLPGLDGWEVARRLRAETATRDLPILGFTAHAERSPLERARRAGCDDVITKPCPPKDLIAVVRRLAERRTTRPRSG